MQRSRSQHGENEHLSGELPEKDEDTTIQPLRLLDPDFNRILPLQHLKRNRKLKLSQALHPPLLNALLLNKRRLGIDVDIALTQESEDVRGRDGTEEVGGGRGGGEALEEEGLGERGERVEEGGLGGTGGGEGVDLWSSLESQQESVGGEGRKKGKLKKGRKVKKGMERTEPLISSSTLFALSSCSFFLCLAITLANPPALSASFLYSR